MLPRVMVANNAAFALTAVTEYVNVPADFLGVLSFTIDAPVVNSTSIPQVQLDYVSPQNIAYLKQKRRQSAANDTPGLYTIVGSQFQFLPIICITGSRSPRFPTAIRRTGFWRTIPTCICTAR